MLDHRFDHAITAIEVAMPGRRSEHDRLIRLELESHLIIGQLNLHFLHFTLSFLLRTLANLGLAG
ncbi:hypothetical protein THICB2_300002 [Thiomonas sp. CB2]|nr:hypothetical protein THICB2_300002 [Thiomonas sp. CB2]